MTEITDKIVESASASRTRHIRRYRHRRRRREDHAGRWAPPAAWVAIALLVGPYLPAWAWMWTIALALFVACKWATWWPYRFNPAPAGRHAGFLVGYAGMDAESFFLGPPVPAPSKREWLKTAGRVAGGAALVWLIAPSLGSVHPQLATWMGMIGLVLMLHFGLLDALALAWRARGIKAEPLMRQPSRARSLAEFWGRRWNTGFRALAHDFVFEPLRRPLRAAGATATVFLASGLVHDLVISLPARGGFGLPTLYFAIQLAGLLLERTSALRHTFARYAILGRLYTISFIVAPLPLLVHPPFVAHVMVPFLKSIGGLS